VYKNPFSTLVDVTGNLIQLEIPGNETGLLANSNVEKKILWTYNAADNALYSQKCITLSSYTRLGI
jgi:hypothetical protein